MQFRQTVDRFCQQRCLVVGVVIPALVDRGVAEAKIGAQVDGLDACRAHGCHGRHRRGVRQTQEDDIGIRQRRVLQRQQRVVPWTGEDVAQLLARVAFAGQPGDLRRGMAAQ